MTGLYMAMRSHILNLFLELQQEMAISFIYVSQHIGVVKHIADKVIVMHEGEVVEAGSTEDIFTNPQHPVTQRLLSSHFDAPTHDRKQRIGAATPNIKY